MLLVGSGKYPWAGPPQLEVPEVGYDVLKLSPRPRVIPIPRLCDAGVGYPEVTDEREDPYAICDHGKGVPLCHALLAVLE